MREEANGILFCQFGLSDNDRKSTTQHQTSPWLTLLSEETLYVRTKKFNIILCIDRKKGESVDSFITSPALPASTTLQLLFTIK